VTPHDPDLAISWPLQVTLMSARDANAGSWQDLLAHLR
jgi:dTDP-4-dehydrorhamnose 3,5-epimerase